jgi:hypothetical protein
VGANIRNAAISGLIRDSQSTLIVCLLVVIMQISDSIFQTMIKDKDGKTIKAAIPYIDDAGRYAIRPAVY